ncbi:MAG: glycosyltransferase family 2 protein [Chloroflexota bacterium]
MNDIQFSVVIPTYNRGHLAVRAVESVLAQTVLPAEIIVVDDGSKDNTRELIAEFGDKVRYIQQQNQGSAVARNNGMRQAKCSWIALLDSDDVWLPSHLATMANAIKETAGSARYYFADTIRPIEKGSGSRWEGVGFSITGEFELNDVASEWVLYRPQPMMLQSTVFNKQAYLEAGGFLPALRYRDDTHLFLKLGLDGPVCAVGNVGTKMTSDDAPTNRLTLSYDGQLKGAQMQVIMFNDLLDKMPHLPTPVQQELKRRLAYAYLAVARHTWKSKKYGEAMSYLLDCARTKPSVVTGSIQRNLQKVLSF